MTQAADYESLQKVKFCSFEHKVPLWKKGQRWAMTFMLSGFSKMLYSGPRTYL